MVWCDYIVILLLVNHAMCKLMLLNCFCYLTNCFINIVKAVIVILYFLCYLLILYYEWHN